MWFGIVACPDVVPEPETLAGGIHDAVHELGKESSAQRVGSASPAPDRAAREAVSVYQST